MTEIHIPIPIELVIGVVRNQRDEGAAVMWMDGHPQTIAPNSVFAWVSKDATDQELRLLLQQVFRVLEERGLPALLPTELRAPCDMRSHPPDCGCEGMGGDR